MSIKAEEIQSSWEVARGDLYVDDEYNVHYWIDENKNRIKIKGGKSISRNENVYEISRVYWLPSQEQLMDNLVSGGNSIRKATFDFFEWTKKSYLEGPKTEPSKFFISLEQLWMAFVMEQRYGKKWDGHVWVQI